MTNGWLCEANKGKKVQNNVEVTNLEDRKDDSIFKKKEGSLEKGDGFGSSVLDTLNLRCQ